MADAGVAMGGKPFRLGVNYWPAATAMDWLARYDPAVTRADFRRMAMAGLSTIRVFLRWEDAQPAPDRIDAAVLDRLVDAADAAGEAGAELVVTLFTGHMSGVNWLPGWAVGPGEGRFRTVSAGALTPGQSRNWYGDSEVWRAQERLARAAAGALRGHPALWAWDLGNENSNCSVPPDPVAGAAWLERMAGALRAGDPGTPVTVGLHMEDLEEDRMIGPAEAARVCDIVSMHGYPIYAPWAAGPQDDLLVPFLAEVTGWLAGGAPVLFEEFGLPTRPPGSGAPGGAVSSMAVDEGEAARYTGAVLDRLWTGGCAGALLWCANDYAPDLFAQAPFDEAIHERSFGLWRAGGTPKPAVAAVAERVGRMQLPPPPAKSWLDLSPSEFNEDRRGQLARLYRRYRGERNELRRPV
jgi:endo-1,4-beta-mannosidase